jgi:hypothetical protein
LWNDNSIWEILETLRGQQSGKEKHLKTSSLHVIHLPGKDNRQQPEENQNYVKALHLLAEEINYPCL